MPRPYYPKRKSSVGLIMGAVVAGLLLLIVLVIVLTRKPNGPIASGPITGGPITSGPSAGGVQMPAECEVFYTPSDERNAGKMFRYTDRLPNCVLSCQDALALMEKGKVERTYLLDVKYSRNYQQPLADTERMMWRLFRSKLLEVNANLGCPVIDVKDIDV